MPVYTAIVTKNTRIQTPPQTMPGVAEDTKTREGIKTKQNKCQESGLKKEFLQARLCETVLRYVYL